ncbi:MAG: sulfite oxidase-like oxidoreductase [Armatimonadetes bacterium]|nr:sulfite oxidase-like oxidoreductase [Armatimonadota bacterium]
MATDKTRVPPGQSVTDKWPVLHYASVPRFDPARWNFRIFGLVEQPAPLTYDQFMALPQSKITCDIHCVTAWSRLGVTFEGVLAKDVLGLARVRPEARFATVHAEQGYAANLSLEYLLADDAIFAHKADGQNLTPEHGWPLRLVVPRLYFWKSAKWARGVELIAEDRPGFWEQRGYHMKGDPWKEERYGDPW